MGKIYVTKIMQLEGWKKFAEFIGVDFNKPFWVNESEERLIITVKGVGYYNENREPDIDNVLIIHLIEGILTVRDYPPEGTNVWTLQPEIKEGYENFVWCNGEWLKNLWDRGYVYLTEEEAKKEVKQRNWI